MSFKHFFADNTLKGNPRLWVKKCRFSETTTSTPVHAATEFVVTISKKGPDSLNPAGAMSSTVAGDVLTGKLWFPNNKIGDLLKIFIIGGNVNKIEVVHCKQMESIIREQAVTMQLRQVLNDNVLRRRHNA